MPPNARNGPPDTTPAGRLTRNHTDSPTLARDIKSEVSITGGQRSGTVRDAIAAARRGWHVFPVRPGDKRPAVDRWEERASRDPELVARYWPGARHNIGVACGPSGLVVIDLDPPDGMEHFARLCREHGRPGTFTVRTPRGGSHLYFAALAGREIRNSASKVAPHIDVRGCGGYILAAGAIAGGRAYEITDSRPPVPLPAWLADLADPPAAAPAGAARDLMLALGQPRSYGDAALRGEVAAILGAARGTRNDQLNRSAFALGQLVTAGAVGCPEAAATLIRAADACGLIAEDGIRRCEATIQSGLTAGMANPRVGVAV